MPMTKSAQQKRDGTLARREIDKNYLVQLRSICLIAFIYYGLITVAHFLFLAPEILYYVAGTSALAAIIALIVRIMIGLKKISPANSHVAFVPVISFVLLTVFTHIFLSQEQHQLTNAMLVQYILSLVVMSPLIFGVFTGICTAASLAVLLVIPGDYTAHFVFMQFAAVTLSVLGFFLRYRALDSSVRLLVLSRKKTNRLSAKSRELQAKVIEVEEANAARDVFLANVTHELRTPLTGVLGMLDLMGETRLNEEQKSLVATAQKSAGFLLHIVNDLLDLAELEAGKMALKPEAIDIEMLTGELVATFEAVAIQKGLALTFEGKGPLPTSLHGDGERIGQIILNLVNNAVKFTDKGSVSVTLEYDAKKREAIWHVIDTGPGIPEEKHAKLFERFEQLDADGKSAAAGTGLGLAIVQELTTLLGGTVRVQSHEGEGTDFAVSIPLKAKGTKSVPPKDPAEQEELPSLAHHNLHVLVAEDNDINQTVIKLMLEQIGVKATFVGNGEQAVAAATDSTQKFDLVFMDVQMPVMDGIAATKHICEQMDAPPPVIALTANTSSKDRAHYLMAGMEDTVGKPIKLPELHKCILQYTGVN